MDERIQFCRARDGVRLAHATTGAGFPLVKVANWLSHLEYDIESPVWGHLFRALAAEHVLIRYDQRGTGLSDRDVGSMSFADWTTDLETVVDAVRLERFDLLGISQGGPVAIAYAVQHPERVRHLILYGTFAIAPKQSDDEQQALLVLMREGWGQENQAYRQFFTSLFIPGGTAEQMRWFNELERRSASPLTAVRVLKEIWTIDVAQMAARLTVPTLILHCRGDQAVPFSAGRELAALVPGASFVPMEGSNHYFLEHEPAREIFLRELHAFMEPPGEHGLQEGTRQDTAGGVRQEPPAPSRLAAETTSVVRPQAQGSFASGRYVLKRMLGEGAQKSVYLVQDTVLDRECALALVKSDLAEPEDILRIRREAQTMARIGARTNVVTVHDLGEEDDRPYIVCEYVPGGDLRAELRAAGGPLPTERAVAIATDVARALVVAHARGVIHRDLKPSNVWMNEDGSAKLGDFGIAFSMDRSRMTMAGTLLGTAAYLAPEQALGHEVDARSDLYSLGAMLYELVTGQTPFPGEDALRVVTQHLNATPTRPSAHNPALPEALDGLVLRLLAKAPDERPASAAAVIDELDRIAQDLRRAADAPPAKPSASP